jgi:hypothetical protein
MYWSTVFTSATFPREGCAVSNMVVHGRYMAVTLFLLFQRSRREGIEAEVTRFALLENFPSLAGFHRGIIQQRRKNSAKPEFSPCASTQIGVRQAIGLIHAKKFDSYVEKARARRFQNVDATG